MCTLDEVVSCSHVSAEIAAELRCSSPIFQSGRHSCWIAVCGIRERGVRWRRMLEDDHKCRKRAGLRNSLQCGAEGVVCLLLLQHSEQGVSPGIAHRCYGEHGRRTRLEEVRVGVGMLLMFKSYSAKIDTCTCYYVFVRCFSLSMRVICASFYYCEFVAS